MFAKIAILVHEYRHTEVQAGSRPAFLFWFWTTKLLAFARRLHPKLKTWGAALFRHLPPTRFVIKNQSGIWAVQSLDDSMTICSDYFERGLREWLMLPKNKNIFIDIGANRGLYTVLAGKHYDFASVYSFEPNPDIYSILLKNLELNELSSKVQTFEAGVGKEAATVDFLVDPVHQGGGRITDQIQGTEETSFRVNMVSLDAAVPDQEKAKVSFIKIDTEGYEKMVLSGMNGTLRAMLPGSYIMLETSDLPAIKDILSAYQFQLVESSNYDHLFVKS